MDAPAFPLQDDDSEEQHADREEVEELFARLGLVHLVHFSQQLSTAPRYLLVIFGVKALER